MRRTAIHIRKLSDIRGATGKRKKRQPARKTVCRYGLARDAIGKKKKLFPRPDTKYRIPGFTTIKSIGTNAIFVKRSLIIRRILMTEKAYVNADMKCGIPKIWLFV